jgi:hypothetical protein
VIDVLIEVEGGQHQDPRRAAAPDEQGGCLDPVHFGHTDFHQDYVGIESPGLRERLAGGAALRRRPRSGSASRSLADVDLIIDDQDDDHDGARYGPDGSPAATFPYEDHKCLCADQGPGIVAF